MLSLPQHSHLVMFSRDQLTRGCFLSAVAFLVSFGSLYQTMRLLKRSDSSASTAQAPKHKRSISRFFSNLSLSSRATRPDRERPASVLGFGTYPAARSSEQTDRGVRGEHGLLGRASFDALSSRFGRGRNVSFSHTSVLDDPTLGPVVEVGRETDATPGSYL